MGKGNMAAARAAPRTRLPTTNGRRVNLLGGDGEDRPGRDPASGADSCGLQGRGFDLGDQQHGRRAAQLTAFFTNAPILASSAAVNFFSAKATGHTPPSSRCARSLKPNVAYLVLNFCALWKKQTTLPSLA